MRHVAEVLAETAWDRYAVLSAQASRILRGQQLGLFDETLAAAREWRGIALACDAEAVRVAA